MHRLLSSCLLATVLLSGCSGNDDDGTGTVTEVGAGANTGARPVTGEFHGIEPADVESYVAAFEARRARLGLVLDGTRYEIGFEGIDERQQVMALSYGSNTLLVGFDEQPATGLTIIESDGATDTRRLEGPEIFPEDNGAGDTVYRGRVRDTASDEEFDVVLTLNESLVDGGTSTLEVDGTDAVLNGDLGTLTYLQVRDMLAANPAVDRLVLQASSGSINDDINVHTGRLVRAANLATHVPADGDINSGAVDLFTAGMTRTVAPGGTLGVHSWCCADGLTADQLPRDSIEHGIQLTYFREMLPETGEDFYFFTLEAAPFDGIHRMTREEMTRYELLTATSTPETTGANDGTTRRR